MKTGRIAIGAFIGTLFALMFAPQKGKNIRLQMKKKNDGVEPLTRGYRSLLSEFARVVTKQVHSSVSKNPFTVTSLRK